MSSPFCTSPHSPEDICEHRAKRLEEEIKRKLNGISCPQIPKLTGNSIAEISSYRIQEINLMTDIGWGDPQSINFATHHIRNAISIAEAFAQSWRFNTLRGGPGGWNDLAKSSSKMILDLRARIDPALHVAKIEFDPTGYLGRYYDELEVSHLDQIASINLHYGKMRLGAKKASRSRIRDQEILALQRVLDSLVSAIRQWENNFKLAFCEVGFVGSDNP